MNTNTRVTTLGAFFSAEKLCKVFGDYGEYQCAHLIRSAFSASGDPLEFNGGVSYETVIVKMVKYIFPYPLIDFCSVGSLGLCSCGTLFITEGRMLRAEEAYSIFGPGNWVLLGNEQISNVSHYLPKR